MNSSCGLVSFIIGIKLIVISCVCQSPSRAFAVVASALGIPSLLPFLKAVCRSKKSWQARHTGIKIVQQIAILMGCAVLPHLKSLVEIIENGKVTARMSS